MNMKAMTQQQLADRAGVSRDTLRRWLKPHRRQLEALGMRREIRVDFILEPKLGDYVIVHAGFAIERLGEAQALEDLEAWEEMRDVL